MRATAKSIFSKPCPLAQSLLLAIPSRADLSLLCISWGISSQKPQEAGPHSPEPGFTLRLELTSVKAGPSLLPELGHACRAGLCTSEGLVQRRVPRNPLVLGVQLPGAEAFE